MWQKAGLEHLLIFPGSSECIYTWHRPSAALLMQGKYYRGAEMKDSLVLCGCKRHRLWADRGQEGPALPGATLEKLKEALQCGAQSWVGLAEHKKEAEPLQWWEQYNNLSSTFPMWRLRNNHTAVMYMSWPQTRVDVQTFLPKSLQQIKWHDKKCWVPAPGKVACWTPLPLAASKGSYWGWQGPEHHPETDPTLNGAKVALCNYPAWQV